MAEDFLGFILVLLLSPIIVLASIVILVWASIRDKRDKRRGYYHCSITGMKMRYPWKRGETRVMT